MWGVANDMLGSKVNSCPSYLEIKGTFLTKPLHIANYFNDYFQTKINSLRNKMQQSSVNNSTT